jgi:hypothetical protein
VSEEAEGLRRSCEGEIYNRDICTGNGGKVLAFRVGKKKGFTIETPGGKSRVRCDILELSF